MRNKNRFYGKDCVLCSARRDQVCGRGKGGLYFGIAYKISGKDTKQELDLHALKPPLVLAVKFNSKVNEWPDDTEAPCILVSFELCAERCALEYPLHLL